MNKVGINAIPVGASLLAIADSHSTSMLAGLPLSRASSLPQRVLRWALDRIFLSRRPYSRQDYVTANALFKPENPTTCATEANT
ncbi:hypothetical protein CD175_17845 [Pseudomonas laurylsulfatiphila]|uniref:Uncharacterized protein n=1 Tax=Pseudomonas laurylsulfatiphila TaxID=2011015 RepID=A0A2S6FL02_9PSED|nr:hypothetical protein CD175_17845 [Pseudomonas laurylsulfatiphila]